MSLINRLRRASSSAWTNKNKQTKKTGSICKKKTKTKNMLGSRSLYIYFIGHNKKTRTQHHRFFKILNCVMTKMSITMRNWALACCTRLSCLDWLTLVKMPASGLKCSTLPWRLVRKWPKLRIQHTRTTHWKKHKDKKNKTLMTQRFRTEDIWLHI